MKAIWFATLLPLVGCATTDRTNPFTVSPTNLSEPEIRSLATDTKFEDIEKRLHYYTHPEIAIPLISFVIEGKKEEECMMLFDDSSKHLLYAWSSSEKNPAPERAIMLWPKNLAGKKLSEIEMKLGNNTEANQALEPTSTAVTPPAVAGDRASGTRGSP